MFTIRQQHKDSFSTQALREFERAAVAHLRQQLPSFVANVNDDDLRQRVAATIQDAGRFGLVTQRQIMCFLDAEVLLGRRFYADPAQHWADTLLRSDKLGPDDKAGLLLATACSIHKDRAGEKR